MDKLCECNKKLVEEIKEFLENVGDVKEESITDYLVWKWKEIDKRFNCVKTDTHSRYKENLVTGADFDLELWILEDKGAVSLAVQAKKFLENYDCYASAIRYPDNSSQQIDKLLSYSKNKDKPKIPVYFLYSIPDKSETYCREHYVKSGVFVVSAYKMKEFSRLEKGKKLALDTILDKSYSLSCCFCHEKDERDSFFNSLGLGESFDYDVTIPDYVEYISNGGISNKNLPKNSRWIAVYDLRDKNVPMD